MKLLLRVDPLQKKFPTNMPHIKWLIFSNYIVPLKHQIKCQLYILQREGKMIAEVLKKSFAKPDKLRPRRFMSIVSILKS